MSNWFLLPGMGATLEMYDSLKRELSLDIHYLNWPHYRGETTFREIAERIILENRIEDGDIVGGSSLGGMIALEIGMILKLKAIVLIGSAMHPAEVNPLLSVLTPLTSVTPIAFIQTLAGKDSHLLSQMFADSDPDFIRAMCKYISTWPGYTGPQGIVHRIHGKKDHVIKYPKTNCKILDEAGHLLAMTHPKECANFFNSLIITRHVIP